MNSLNGVFSLLNVGRDSLKNDVKIRKNVARGHTFAHRVSCHARSCAFTLYLLAMEGRDDVDFGVSDRGIGAISGYVDSYATRAFDPSETTTAWVCSSFWGVLEGGCG